MIWFSFPASTAASSAFLVLVLAWSVADTVRYVYLAVNLHGKAPAVLVWLRYVIIPSFPLFIPSSRMGVGGKEKKEKTNEMG
jgi:very-long-chain (3R)-3-hydroxyacyl-CoA dehydratase